MSFPRSPLPLTFDQHQRLASAAVAERAAPTAAGPGRGHRRAAGQGLGGRAVAVRYCDPVRGDVDVRGGCGIRLAPFALTQVVLTR